MRRVIVMTIVMIKMVFKMMMKRRIAMLSLLTMQEVKMIWRALQRKMMMTTTTRLIMKMRCVCIHLLMMSREYQNIYSIYRDNPYHPPPNAF